MDNGSRSRFPDGFRIMQGRREYVTYLDHASVRIWYSETSETYESHCHSAVEIILPIRGEVVYRLPDRIYRVSAGEALIVPSGCDHELSMDAGSARYLFLFEPDSLFSLRDMPLIGDVLHAPVYVAERPEVQDGVHDLLMRCVECYEARDFMWNAMCYALLLEMYVLIGRSFSGRCTRVDPQEGRRMNPEILDSARLYIDRNFSRAITLEEVSEFTGFSKYYFSRVFKQQMGASFSEYLRARRVAMAEDMLIHSRKSIREIAVEAGFGSVATFNRVFREVKHCAPSRFREIYGDMS